MARNIEATQLGVDEIESWKGLDLLDEANKKFGKLKDIYLDETSEQPKWGVATMGLITTREIFVPLAAAVHMDDGIHVKAKKDQVDAAPEVPVDGQLSHDNEHKLTVHYGLDQRSDEEIQKEKEIEITMVVPQAETSDGAQPEAERTLPPGVAVKIEHSASNEA